MYYWFVVIFRVRIAFTFWAVVISRALFDNSILVLTRLPWLNNIIIIYYYFRVKWKFILRSWQTNNWYPRVQTIYQKYVRCSDIIIQTVKFMVHFVTLVEVLSLFLGHSVSLLCPFIGFLHSEQCGAAFFLLFPLLLDWCSCAITISTVNRKKKKKKVFSK